MQSCTGTYNHITIGLSSATIITTQHHRSNQPGTVLSDRWCPPQLDALGVCVAERRDAEMPELEKTKKNHTLIDSCKGIRNFHLETKSGSTGIQLNTEAE